MKELKLVVRDTAKNNSSEYVNAEKALVAVTRLKKHLESTKSLHTGKIKDVSLSNLISLFNL